MVRKSRSICSGNPDGTSVLGVIGPFKMVPGRSAIVLTVAAVVAFTLPILGAGCGSESVEVDKAANYTPETLAQELILRYRALKPDAKTPRRGPIKKASGAAVSRKTAPPTTKKRGSATIDDVLEDIGSKIALVKESSPAATTQKMTETIASDSSLSDSDRKALSELVGRLAD
jgi:hypothetical protein